MKRKEEQRAKYGKEQVKRQRQGTEEEERRRGQRGERAGGGGQVPGGSVNPASCARAGPGRRCPGRCEPGASGDVRGKQGSQSPKPEAAEAPNRVYVYTRFQAPRLLEDLISLAPASKAISSLKKKKGMNVKTF